MENENNNARRYPHNSGLPNFAMETTSSEDAPDPETFAEIYPERLLEKAFRSLSVDVDDVLPTVCKILMDSEDDEEKIEMMEALKYFVECKDTANDFCKIGGLPVLMKCLDSDITPLRKYTLRTIGLMLEDNPFCQRQFFDNSFLPKLVELSYDPELLGIALHGISGIILTYEAAITIIMDIGFLKNLLAYVNFGYLLSTQILIFLQELIRDYPIVREKLLELGIIQRLTPVLNQATTIFDILIDIACSILNSLTEISEACRILREEDVQFSIENIIKLQKDNPLSEEMIEMCESILKKLFSINGAPAVDR